MSSRIGAAGRWTSSCFLSEGRRRSVCRRRPLISREPRADAVCWYDSRYDRSWPRPDFFFCRKLCMIWSGLIWFGTALYVCTSQHHTWGIARNGLPRRREHYSAWEGVCQSTFVRVRTDKGALLFFCIGLHGAQFVFLFSCLVGSPRGSLVLGTAAWPRPAILFDLVSSAPFRSTDTCPACRWRARRGVIRAAVSGTAALRSCDWLLCLVRTAPEGRERAGRWNGCARRTRWMDCRPWPV